jgi:hypothetical protein
MANPDNTDTPASDRSPFDEIFSDFVGRVLAMEEIVVALLASHARMNPDGVAAQMLADQESALETYGPIPGPDGDLPSGYLTEAKRQALSQYLGRAEAMLDRWHRANRG